MRAKVLWERVFTLEGDICAVLRANVVVYLIYMCVHIGVIIIIIIITLRHQHGYLWPTLATLLIVYYFRQVFRATSRIGTKLLYVGSRWSYCLCSSMWRGLQEYITYEFVPTSPGVVCLTLIVFMMGGRWPYSCCFVGCCLQELFNIACSIFV